MLWCERNHASRTNKALPQLQKIDKNPPPFPREASVLILISNMTADNFTPNKQIMHNQEGNSRFVNILDHMSNFLDVLSRLEGPMCTKMSVRIAHSILSLLQGPDRAIQEHFVIRTDMLMALNRFMRTSFRPFHEITPEWSEDFDTLKEILVDLLRAAIEGQNSHSVVVERLQTTVEISILNVLILPVETDEDGNSLELSNLTRLQAKYLVFLQALADRNTEMPFNAMERLNEDITFVEVMWEGKLTKHYFHIPEIAKDLSENSKIKLIDDIEFSTQEKKLKDFLKKAKDLHREAEHQQLFKSFGVVHLWAWKTFIAKLLFISCLIMNGLMTAFYTSNEDAHPQFVSHFSDPIVVFGHDPVKSELQGVNSLGEVDRELRSTNSSSISPSDLSLPMDIYDTIHVLNGVHIALSLLAYLIILVVQVPLLYRGYVDEGKVRGVAVLFALLNPVPLWYLVHTFISLEAFSRTPLFLSLLLLQFIAVDSASNEVMLAVIYPFRQLLTTLVIIVIFLHIFASAIFIFFRDEFLNLPCTSMWQSFKLMISYGFRSEEGIGRYMEDTIGIRIIVDVAFYFIIVVILRNIFFGVVIDTFGELRSGKVERQADSNSRCFICGIDQGEFDKKTTATHDFKIHRNVTHNMWNYLFFVMKIWKQRPSQDTSLEKYVRQCLLDVDVNWFPIGLIGREEGEMHSDLLMHGTGEPKDGYNEGTSSHVDRGVAGGAVASSGDSNVNSQHRREFDTQLQRIQDTLGKLTTIQARSRGTSFLVSEGESCEENSVCSSPTNRSRPVGSGSSSSSGSAGTLDAATKEVIESVVRKEIAPVSCALVEAMNDMNGLLERLQAVSDMKKPKKMITMSPKVEK